MGEIQRINQKQGNIEGQVLQMQQQNAYIIKMLMQMTGNVQGLAVGVGEVRGAQVVRDVE